MSGSSTLVTFTTWNVQHASPSRTREQVDWIVATAPSSTAHVLVLTETASRIATPDPLAESLCAQGYSVSPSTGEGLGVVLAARGARLDVTTTPSVTVLPHRCRGATVSVSGRDLRLVGLYVPSRGPAARRNQDKRTFQTAVTAALPDVTRDAAGGAPVVVAGDLNVVEPGHVPHHRVFGAWEYDFYRSFAGHGLDDAFRHLHANAHEHSWFGRRSRLGYRFDHLFLSRAHLPALVSCSYDQSPRERSLSDHAAMSMTLDLDLLPLHGPSL